MRAVESAGSETRFAKQCDGRKINQISHAKMFTLVATGPVVVNKKIEKKTLLHRCSQPAFCNMSIIEAT